MCGIGLVLVCGTPIKADEGMLVVSDATNSVSIDDIGHAIAPRGPDKLNIVSVSDDLTLTASLLALRGKPTPQPICSEEHFLCWNGQVFGDEQMFEEIADTNDTKYLFEHLRDETQILATISRTQGPYSFIFVTKQTIYFGKDPMGRRSLLHTYDGQAFKLTSTAPDKSAWNELGTDGIYSLDRNTNSLTLHLWSDMYERYNVTPVLISRPETSITPEQDFIIDANLYQQSVDKLIILLTRSVEKRVTNIYDTQDRAHVGVLFSGGIDSVIITAMAQLVLQNQPIDLLNVSFGSSQKQIDSGADRKQAIEAYQELKSLYPESKFNLVLIDVLDNELPTIKATVEQLIFPRNTVLDFNIGTALWCAARGIGYLFETKESYTSGARVLLCGIGSDEQLAGYGRHRTSFNRGGWSALDQELDMDIRRLWIRNLARDDRLISYHGKEARNPFLDEEFIKFCRTSPLWYLTDMRTSDGDKKILRDAAHQMGLLKTSKYTKRAIQFGSNIAKISYKKCDGDTLI